MDGNYPVYTLYKDQTCERGEKLLNELEKEMKILLFGWKRGEGIKTYWTLKMGEHFSFYINNFGWWGGGGE